MLNVNRTFTPRSVSTDLESRAGTARAKELVTPRPYCRHRMDARAAAALGLDYAALALLNPRSEAEKGN
jgi:hypothetical protein